MKVKSMALAVAGGLALAGPALAAGDRGAGESAQMGAQQAAMAGQHDQETVRKVQQALNDKGHGLQIDGMMGPGTESALRDFQQQQGLDATGQIDRQTLAALNVEGAAPRGGEASPAPAGSQPTTPQPPADTGTTGAPTTTDQGTGTQTGDQPGTTTTPGGTTN